MSRLEAFYKQITEWLLPLGYVEIFKNHPSMEVREFHFIKDRVRVICVIKGTEIYCYLYADAIKLINIVSIQGMKVPIGTDKLQELHNEMVINLNKLELK